jgi:hypothetical protein
MKKCLMSLAINEMQIQTTLKVHFTPLRMATIKKTTNAGKDVSVDPYKLWVAVLICPAFVEASMETPQKTKNRINL